MTEWHLVSCEYPPQIGGVSSYVAEVASALGAANQHVHVWCPAVDGPRPEAPRVSVHGTLNGFTRADLQALDAGLDRFAAPRRLLIQWVPHGYGYRSMNLGFCLWVRERARKGDSIDLMVHEPFLSFDGSWKQKGAAAIHRVMTIILLRAAQRVWVSTPAWRSKLAPFAPSRPLGFGWLPIPSPVAPIHDPMGVSRLRHQYGKGSGHLVGHFGMYSRLTAEPFKAVAGRLLRRNERLSVLLMGEGSGRLREEIVAMHEAWRMRVHSAGVLSPEDLSRHLQACDVLLQPYPEGVTSRRTSTMAPLAHGSAIVTTEGNATEPVWREHAAVSLVPAEDLHALAESVERLLGDSSERARMGTRARELYETCFDTRHTVRALLAS